jgi:hypothetical protein
MYLMILFYSFLLMDGMEVQSWVLRFRWRIYKIVMYIVSPKYNLFDVLSHDNVSWHEFFSYLFLWIRNWKHSTFFMLTCWFSTNIPQDSLGKLGKSTKNW